MTKATQHACTDFHLFTAFAVIPNNQRLATVFPIPSVWMRLSTYRTLGAKINSGQLGDKIYTI